MNTIEAQKLVEEKVVSKMPDCAVIEKFTQEHEMCFVFYYQSKAFIKSNDIRDMLVGQGPVIVDKATGNIYETGSAYSAEHYVAAFEACGDPYGEPGPTIIITGWKKGADKVGATKLVKQAAGIGLSEAKNVIDSVLDGNEEIVTLLDLEKIHNVVKQLEALGFNNKQLWSNQ